MGSVKEDELELGAGSLGLGFGPFSGGDGSKNGQHLGWHLGSGSLHSSRQKPDQGGGTDVDDGGGGGSGGWFFTNNNSNSNSRPPPNLTPAVYWFTTGQWRELQVQGMIYKHLVAGMPIPQEYLRELGWPINQNTQQITHAMAAQYYADRTGGAGINVGGQHHLPGVAGDAAADPEPQRCRRTDGKKWRCGNEAAPGKRYCEKHLHRSRPRSRKPVEPQQVQLQQQLFMPQHAPLPPPPNKFGITVTQELPQVPAGRKHPCPTPPLIPARTEAPPASKNEIISSWNMDRKKAKSDRGSEQDTIRQHLGHGKLNNPEQQHFLWQPQQQQMEQQQQQHSYYPYAAYQDDTFFSLLNSDINSINERHLSFTPDTLSMSHSTEPADRYINFARGYVNNSRTNSISASVSSAASNNIAQSPQLSLPVTGARENGGMHVPMGLTNNSGSAGNGGESTKTPPLWWLADTLITGPSSDMAHARTGTAPTTDDEAGVVSPNTTADNSSSAVSPTGVLQRPLASISDCSSNSSEPPFGHLQATGTGGGAEATGHHLHWMIKP